MTMQNDNVMPRLWAVRLVLGEGLGTSEVSQLEMVFSELLDAEATAHLRDGGGAWQIEALFSHTPDAAIIDELLARHF